MPLFKENEFVIYSGDGSTLNEARRNPSLAIVEIIDENKFPYVKLRLIPSGEFVEVVARLVRVIETNEKRLLKIGFEKKVINRAEHYTLNNFIVGGIVLFPEPGFAYFAGFRHLPSIPFQINSNQLINAGKVNEIILEQLFPNMHNLNHLVKYLNETGLSSMTIPEIVEIEPFY